MPKITGWEKTKNQPKKQVWMSRQSRVESERESDQQPTRVSVQGNPRKSRGKWRVSIYRPNKNPKAPGFQDPIEKRFDKKSKAEDWAIDWMRKNKY